MWPYGQSSSTARALVRAFGHGSYLHWGIIQISLTNFLIIMIMVLVFALAITVPFRRRHHDENREDQP